MTSLDVLALVLAVALLFVVVFTMVACRTKSTGKRVVFSVLGAASLLLPCWLFVAMFFPQWIDGRYRAYRNFYADLSPGMTRDQVFDAMDRNYPPGGARKRPRINADTPERLSFFMDTEGAREPNHEGISLDFSNGKVTRKGYSAD